MVRPRAFALVVAAPYRVVTVAVDAVDLSTGSPKQLLGYTCPAHRQAIVLSFWCRFGPVNAPQPGTEIDVISGGATHELLQQGGQDVDLFGLFQGLTPGDSFRFMQISDAGAGSLVKAQLTVLEIVP